MSSRPVRWIAALLICPLTAACTGSKDSGSSDPKTLPASPPIAGEPILETGLPYSWKSLRQGAGGFVTGLVAHSSEPGRIYARTDVGGAYRFDESTTSWQQMITTAGVPGWEAYRFDYYVESIAISESDPNTVYISAGNDPNPGGGAITGTGRVLRSDDGGVTWQSSGRNFSISGNQEYRQLGERLAVDPKDSRHVLLGTRREGLWSSRDGGLSWSQISTDQVPIVAIEPVDKDQPGIGFVTFDSTDPSNVFAGVAGVGVLRSSDGGETWTSIRELQGATVPTDGQFVNGALLVAFNDAGLGQPGEVALFDSASETWTDITPAPGPAWWAVAADPTTPGHLIGVSMQTMQGQLFRSTDNGQSWKSATITDEAGAIPWIDRFTEWDYLVIGRLVFDPTVAGRLWWTSGIGVFRTDDVTTDTVQLELVSDGIEELVSSDLIAPTGGDPVSAVADFLGFRHLDPDAFPASTVDGGRFAGGTDIDYAGQNPAEMVWIGAEYNMFYSGFLEPRASTSSDGGTTWQALPNLTEEFFGGEVAISATDPDNIVWLPSYFDDPAGFAERPKGLYVTADRGGSWTRLADVGGTNDFHRQMWWLSRQSLAADKVLAATFYLMSSDGRFFRSVDGGLTWDESPESPPCNQENDCHVFGQLRANPTLPGVLWASLAKGGLMRSDDGGQSWDRVAGIVDARSFGFGAPLESGGPLAVYVAGSAAGSSETGLWRSGDDGATWELIARSPLGIYQTMTVVSGDLDVPGRVYVGFTGSGFAYGDDPRIG